MRNKGGKTASRPAEQKHAHKAKLSDTSFTVGRTIAGSSHRGRSESIAREELHRRKRRKNATIVAVVVMLLISFGIVVYSLVADYVQRKEFERVLAERRAVVPTVPVKDENAGGSLSSRASEFIVQLEGDVEELGEEIDHVIIPHQKARELVVFLKDRDEYYKLSIDRPSAVQAEDMGRMIGYLDEHGLKCKYVDLRIEGRAYYK